jgi:lipopolysaccharide export system protein LptA
MFFAPVQRSGNWMTSQITKSSRSPLAQAKLSVMRIGVAFIIASTLSWPVAAQNETADLSQGIRIKSLRQEANSKTQIVTARDNVQISYPARQLQARANFAQYFIKEQRMVMTGDVYVKYQGNTLQGETITYTVRDGQFLVVPKAGQVVESVYNAAPAGKARQNVIIRSDRQEANSKTQVVIARDNVQIAYPSQNLRARANIAQFFAKEQRLVLSGNVVALQKGNSIQGETLTYSIKEGKFVAMPRSGGSVESIYVIPESGN